MKVTYEDLIDYLDESKDWHRDQDEMDYFLYNGPDDAYGEPIQLVLPPDANMSNLELLMEMAVRTLATIEGIHADAMADRITPSSVATLMDAISHFATDPPIFKVWIMADPSFHGFDAYVNFRNTSTSRAAQIAMHAHAPELALRGLLSELEAKHPLCPHCGRDLVEVKRD